MSIRKLVLFGDPRLRAKFSKADFNSPSKRKMMRDLTDTLVHLQKIHKKGGGLAAPQIGYQIKATHIRAKGLSFFMFNPKIVRKSKEMFDVWDFCFSSNASFLAKIKRHRAITVEFCDENGAKKRVSVKNYFSELFQHEIDHLNGILFIDRIKDPSGIMMAEEWGKKHKYTQK